MSHAEWEKRTFVAPLDIAALKHLRSRAFGVGIPDDPTDDNMKRILTEHLCTDNRTQWLTGQTLTPLASDKISWADGYGVYQYDRSKQYEQTE